MFWVYVFISFWEMVFWKSNLKTKMMFVYFGGDNYYCSSQIMSEGKMYFERKLKNKVVFFLSLVVKSCRCLEV